jgi:5'-nucleotidase
MNVLITNDDGVFSQGFAELINELQTFCSVTAVAPDRERSAIGHAVTFFDPIRVQRLEKRRHATIYSSTGTPTDCVLLGLSSLSRKKPDLIITGINLGPNVGDDITYSGTVSSAMEGALRGIPSMAVSLATFTEPLFRTAAVIAGRIARMIHAQGLPPRTLLNVNVPNVPLEKIAGISITCQGESTYDQKFTRRKDPRGKDYFWFAHSRPIGDDLEGTDFYALSHNFVSITPLQLNLTCATTIKSLKKWGLSGILAP